MASFPTRILYLYSEWQNELDNLLESLHEITFQKGFPDKVMDLFGTSENNLLRLDHPMTKAEDTTELADLFTKVSHHRNLPIIYNVQNLFHKSMSLRTASLNS